MFNMKILYENSIQKIIICFYYNIAFQCKIKIKVKHTWHVSDWDEELN